MHIATENDCRAYVEVQLADLRHRRPEWHGSPSTAVPVKPLSWLVRKDPPGSDAWYSLEGDLSRQEFLVWFGNHQVGSEGLHWIMRPAVHVAFQDLAPRGDPIALHYSLADVMNHMIHTLEARGSTLRFEMNTFSLT